jgi:hypothetical protein
MQSRNRECGPVERAGRLGIRDALGFADDLLVLVGAERVETVTTTRNRVSVQPRHLSEGEEIARLLGCDVPEDHHLTTPGYTLWTRQHHGLVVQVRAQLRRPAGAAR